MGWMIENERKEVQDEAAEIMLHHAQGMPCPADYCTQSASAQQDEKLALECKSTQVLPVKLNSISSGHMIYILKQAPYLTERQQFSTGSQPVTPHFRPL